MLRRIRRIPSAPNLDDVVGELHELRAATAVFDVEPLVCSWATGQVELDEGLRTTLRALAALPQLKAVAFLTNSRRVAVGAEATLPSLDVSYRSQARKPWTQLRTLRQLPEPIVVVGDQPLTDGIIASRLGASFIEVGLPSGSPRWVRLQRRLGDLVMRNLLISQG